MAVGRITGQMLNGTLNRVTTDLAFRTTGEANLIQLDATNDRVGIATATPTVPLDVTGAIKGSTTITASTLALGSASITDSTGAISFGNENLTSTGTINGATGSVYGTITLANGSITDSTGAISFGNENVTSTGTINGATGSVFGALTLANGSITDSTGAISFGNENLTTTGQVNTSGVRLLENEITTIRSNDDLVLSANGTGGVQIEGSLTVSSDLTVNGSVTTVNSTTLTVDDKNIELAHSPSGASASDTLADGGGLILKGSTDHTILWANATDDWDFSDSIDLASGKTFKINGTTVVSATNVTTTTATHSGAVTVGSIEIGGSGATVTGILDEDAMGSNSAVKLVTQQSIKAYVDSHVGNGNIVTVGALNSGSITSGFGTIDTGASTITTTGLISGGSLDIDHVLINGTTIGHTDDDDLMTVADGILTVAGEVSLTTLDIGGTNVTTTAAEINLIDGGTARGTDALADGDGILINDGGTMKMTTVQTVSTYMAAESVGGGNIVTTGALASGSIAAGFGAIDNGTSGIRTNTFTAETSIIPDASGGADIGSTSAEWGDIFVADDKYVQLGNDQDIKIGYDETTTDALVIEQNVNGAGLAIVLKADQGGDAGDEWKLNVADGGVITLGNDIASAGTFVTHLTVTPHATVTSSTVALAGLLTTVGLTIASDGATVTGIKDEDDMSSDSAVKLATQQSIKAYVDSQSQSAGTLTVIDDSSSAVSVIIANDDLTIAGGTNMTTAASGDVLTVNMDAALSGLTSIQVDSLNIQDNSITSDSNANIEITPGGTGNIVMNKTDNQLILPTGTTGQRNGSTVGSLRYNTSTGTFEGYSATGWGGLGGGDLTAVDDSSSTISVTLSANSVKFAGGANITTSVSGGDTITSALDTALTGLTAVTVDNLNLDGNTITASTGDITLAPAGSGDVNIGANLGLTFGNDGEKIEGDGTDLTISSSAKMNLTATTDIQVPAAVGLLFGTGGEKIESDGTDLTATVTGNMIISGTTAIVAPKGTTGQRPSVATGLIRYNSSLGVYEGSTDGSTFVSFLTSPQGEGADINKDVFTTANASTTAFALSFTPAEAQNVIVYIDNIIQEPTQNYTVSGSTLTMTAAPHASARVVVLHGFDGSGGVSGATWIGGSNTDIDSAIENVDTWTTSTFQSAEYTYMAKNAEGDGDSTTGYETGKILIVHDSSTAQMTQYGITHTSTAPLMTFSVDIDSGSIRLRAASIAANTSIKFARLGLSPF